MATKKQAETTTENVTTEPTRAQLLGQARNNAVNRLIQNDPDTFRSYMEQESSALGVEWKPRATAEEREAKKQAEERAKAEEKLAALLAKHPELRDTFAPVAAENQVNQEEDDALTA